MGAVDVVGTVTDRLVGGMMFHSEHADLCRWLGVMWLAKAHEDGYAHDARCLRKLRRMCVDRMGTFPPEGRQERGHALDVLGYVMGKGFAGAVKYRGAVASYDELPDDGPVIGDMYNVLAADATHGVNAGDYVAWNGETWDVQGTTLDISPLFDTLTDAQIRELIG